METSARTIYSSTDTTVADAATKSSVSTSRLRWLRRLAGLLLALTASFGLAGPAHAFIPPGPQTYVGTPGTFEVSMTCLSGQIVLAPRVAVQTNYVNGQYVVYRYALWSNRGLRDARSGWSGPQLQPYSASGFGGYTYLYPRVALPTAYIPAPRGTYFEVAVQVGWYVPGYGYVYSTWRAVDGYQSGFLSPYPYSGSRSCNT